MLNPKSSELVHVEEGTYLGMLRTNQKRFEIDDLAGTIIKING